MNQTAWRIAVMGAALLGATRAAPASAAPAPGDTPPPAAPALPVAPPVPPPALSPGSLPLPPGATPPLAWGPVATGAPAGGPPSGAWPGSPPSGDLSKPKRRWYGWQILLPAIASDLLSVGGLFLSTDREKYAYAPPVFIASAVGHALSGPIVHFAHGHPGKAGASFLLNGALPGAALSASYASFVMCDNRRRFAQSDGSCYLPTIIILFVTIPATFVGGLIVDTVLVANEDIPRGSAAGEGQRGAAFSLAPLVIPPLGSDLGTVRRLPKGFGREMPLGLSLVGRF